MFEKLFGRKSDIAILAPVAGEVIPITEVSDPTFSDMILGTGVAIRPTGGKVMAPADGVIDQMFDTGHAVTMTTDKGVEVLIHVGIDTVRLGGNHFIAHVQSGDRVTAGQLLMEFDGAAIAAEGYETITPVVICNMGEFASVEPHPGKMVKPGDIVVTLKK